MVQKPSGATRDVPSGSSPPALLVGSSNRLGCLGRSASRGRGLRYIIKKMFLDYETTESGLPDYSFRQS